ncbi:MAG: hypothetical protein WC665_09070 [Sulfurimonas sp.]|jgi:hypothetical protein
MRENDDLYVNFTSLNNNEDWTDTYNLYKKNIEVFSKVIEKIMNNYKITKIQARDTVLYELMSSNYGKNHKRLLHSKERFKWLIIYLTAIVGISLNSLLSIFIVHKKIKKDVLFEEMFAKGGWNVRFYGYITKKLINKPISQAILYTHPGVNKDIFNKSIERWNGEVINRRYSSMFFSFKESCAVVYNDFFYFYELFKLSKNINTTYIYLRIIRKYLVYSSQIKNIEADVLVAAGDYYWNPIKYFVYKKKIKNIILLQHNFKNEYLHNRLFQCCDFYYAHSNQAIEKLEGIPLAKKYSIGSFQLIPFLENEPIEYDIIFINQTVNDDLTNVWHNLNQKKLVDSFYLLIKNFKLYLEQHSEIKAVYIAKNEAINLEPSVTVKKDYEDLSNIKFMGTYGPTTFELIKKSKLVINMYSSVGFEAYGLDTKVLWVNYNRCCDTFKYDVENEDLHVIIHDTSYEAFEERVNLLLSETEEVEVHYKKLKEKYMNIQENPAKIVANKIYELLGK